MKVEKIDTIQKLKELFKEPSTEEFFVQLNFGCRSSKDITLDRKTGIFYVFNEIDGSEDEYTEEELKDSFLGKAITGGAFWHILSY